MNGLVDILHRSLDASSLRQQTISNNIANAETPNYKAKHVVFEDMLKEAMGVQGRFVGKRTDLRHIPLGTTSLMPQAFQVQDNSVMKNNANNVDIDQEMSNLSKNSIWYNALTQQLNHEFNQIKLATKGRG